MARSIRRVCLLRLCSRRMKLAIISNITKENGKAPMIVPVWTVSMTASPPMDYSTVATVPMLITRMTRKNGLDLRGAVTNSPSA